MKLEQKILKVLICLSIFPYINNEGIETATYTDNQSEGWIDPFMFHGALKSKAIELRS